jgi:hypothetical protein
LCKADPIETPCLGKVTWQARLRDSAGAWVSVPHMDSCDMGLRGLCVEALALRAAILTRWSDERGWG